MTREPFSAVDRAASWLASQPLATLGNVALRPDRARAAAEVLAAVRSRAEELAPALARGDADARAALSDLAEGALTRMQRAVREHATARGRLPALWAALDRTWATRTAEEYIDDPALDPQARQRAMGNLDRFNRLIGSYDAFYDVLRPFFRESGRTRVIDLASGHAGFALGAARRARAEGRDVHITATDILPEYLDMGRERARAEDLQVEFCVQDALDMSNRQPGEFDIVLCTQAIHHFPAGAVAVMFAEAVRVAARAVIFIDGERMCAKAFPLYAYMRLARRDPIIAHDGFISCRKFFVPEELELLARLAPGGANAHAYWLPPAHCVLTLDVSRSGR